MPFIPTIRPQEQQGVPSPVTGNPAPPRADLRGVMGAAGQLGQASQQREISAEPFLAPGRGLQAIGQGLQGIAGLMEKLAMDKAEARNDSAVADADNALSMHFAKYGEEMQRLSPDDWESEWEPRANQAAETLMQNEKLSHAARQRIALMATKWRGDTAVRVATMATVEAGRRAADGWRTSYRRAADEGDFVKSEAIIKAGQPKGYTSDSDTYEGEQYVKTAKEKAAWDAEYRVIQDDPDKYLSENSSVREGETPGEHSRRINAAQGVTYDRTREAVSDVANEIASNPDATEATLAEKAGGRLEPAEMEKWNSELAKRRNLKEQFKRAQPAAINSAFARLLDESEAFDRSKPNAKAEYARIHREAEGLLPEGLRGEVTGTVERKWRASDKPPDAPDYLVQSVKDLSKSMFDAGALGTFKTEETRTTETGGKEKVVTVNPDAEQKALAKRGALMGYMLQKWLPANPDKTPDEALNVMRDWLRGAAPVIRFTKPVKLEPAPPPGGYAPATYSQPPFYEDDARAPTGPLPEKTSGYPEDNILLPKLDYEPMKPIPR